MIGIFGQFGEAAEARVFCGVALDHYRLAMSRDPSGDAFTQRHAQAVDDFGMRILGGAQHERVAFQHVDEAGIAAYKFGDKLDDLVEHFMQGIGSRNATAHAMEEFESRNRFYSIHRFMLPSE